MRIHSLSIALSCSLLLAASGAAQQPSPRKGKGVTPGAARGAEGHSAEAQFSALRQRALGLILQSAADADALGDRGAAARIKAAAADAAWEQEPEQARKLFRNAFEEALAHQREGKGGRREQLTPEISIAPPDLRLEIIRASSRRDAELGSQLMEQYMEEKRREMEERRGGASGPVDAAFGKVDAAADELLTISESLLAVDRKAAIALARRAFASGVPQSAGYFFMLLAARDRDAADQMYRLALERLLRDEAPVPGQLLLLSAYPFGEGQVWVGGGDGLNSYRLEVPTGFVVDERLARQFIEAAFAVLTRVAEADLSGFPDAEARRGSAIFAVRLLEAKVARFSPALLPQWRVLAGKLGSAGHRLRELDRAFEKIAEARESDLTPEAGERIKKLLEWAEKTSNPAERDDLYKKAAFEADRVGEGERALSIADKIGDAEYRRDVRSTLKFGAAMRAVREKRFEEARRLALEVESTEEQAYLFFEIARAALGEKDRGRVIQLLAEAERRAAAVPDAAGRLRVLLGLTYLYASFDPPRGFELATEAVRAANQTPAYGPEQARLVRASGGRRGRGAGVAVAEVEEFKPGKMLAVLARTDFDRALQLAQSLESKPLRLAAVISLCAAVLGKGQVSEGR